MISISSLLNMVQIGFGVLFIILVIIQVMKKRREVPLLRAAAYTTFFLVVAGVAFGKYYASTAPKRLQPIEKSKPLLAITGYTEAIRLSPSDAELYFRRGISNANLARYNDAVSDFTRALDRSPNNPAYLAYRGTAFLYLNDTESAERDFNQVLADLQGKHDPEALLGLASVAMVRHRYDEAISFSTEALPSTTDAEHRCMALLTRGPAYMFENEYSKALDDLNQAYKVCQDSQSRRDILADRANTYRNLKQPELALEDFDMALRLDPNDYRALFDRGSLYVEEGQVEKALSDFDRTIQLHPEPQAYTARADLYVRLNQKDKAEADLEMATKLSRGPNLSRPGYYIRSYSSNPPNPEAQKKSMPDR